MAVALPLSLSVLTSGAAAFAQDRALPSAEPQAMAERKRMLAAIITRALAASRLPEIYADLRRAFGELYLPAMRDILNDPETANLDPEKLTRLKAMVPLVDYTLRAANELDPVIAASRDVLIADLAAQQAKYASEEEVRYLGEMLDTPAARKGFNTVYAFSRWLTAYNQEDMRASKEMSAWLNALKFDLEANPFARKDMSPPSPGKVAKAASAVADFMRVSRVDDMVAEIVGFMKNVVLQVDALKPGEMSAMRDGLEKFEFYYNLGKSTAIAAAPSGLASVLTDEQLGQLHLMVLSPLMAKSFDLLYGAVREATSFTKQDINEFRQLADNSKTAKEKWAADAEIQKRIKMEWDALSERWRARFMSSLSTETRQGLEASLAAFKAVVEEEARRKKEAGEGAPEQQRKL